ncbi:MAG: type III pantothenate kinase [Cytophagales bacterium]|nr:type III pantothenate kinase [Cytophaga sp.]
MNLVIDAGNTNIKLGAFEKDTFLWAESYQNVPDVIIRIASLIPEHIFISSVGAITEWNLQNIHSCIVLMGTKTALPIQIRYESRETLGTDRIAAACAVSYLYKGQNVLFFDAGTCLTHGFTNESGTFMGGSISPGLEMRLQALHQFTAKLPYVPLDQEQLTGNSTQSSILSGVINGMLYEIEGFINAYQNKYGNLIVLITGGNASLFEKRLKQPIFVVTELNLIGLNRILNYNV